MHLGTAIGDGPVVEVQSGQDHVKMAKMSTTTAVDKAKIQVRAENALKFSGISPTLPALANYFSKLEIAVKEDAWDSQRFH